MKTHNSFSAPIWPNTVARRLRTACAETLLPLLLLTLPAVVQAQFNYTTNNGTITITKYTGASGDVTIPDTINNLPVTSIGDSAFHGCEHLINVTIPNSVTSIGKTAFYDCGLTNFTIPSSVTNIGDRVFLVCFNLTAVIVDTNNPVYSSKDGVLFNKNQTTLIECPGGKTGSYAVPNGVTNIGNYAFCDCSLTNVTIPNSVTSIGELTFYDCYHLTRLIIPNSVTNIGYWAFFSNTGPIPAKIYFMGNAPSTVDPGAFGGPGYWAVVYYLPGTTGWENFALLTGVTTVLWNPQAQTSDASFGVRTNCFGFNVTGTTNIPIVVEACTNLANPVWEPLQSCTLTNGSLYFSDPDWTNYPVRLYRVRWP